MTKTELQTALATATNTDKRTAGVFLDTLSSLAYKEDQEERRVRLAWLWQAREAEKESAHRHQPENAAENQNSGQDSR